MDRPATRRFFGPALIAAREGAGIGQDALASEIGISRSYLGDIERRNRDPLDETRILAAAAFLACDPVPLLDAAARDNGEIAIALGDDARRRETAVRLVASWTALTEEQMRGIDAVIGRAA